MVAVDAPPSARRSAARWELWGTYAFLAVDDPALLDPAVDLAQVLLAEVDRACSRFRADSWLTEVNRHPGRWVRVDAVLCDAVSAALAAAEATDGAVDPCLGRTIVSLGYDRDLATVVADPVVGATFVPPLPGAWREVEVTEDAVRIPRGVSLDLGATAKAWAADRVAEEVVGELGCTTVVSLGGDLRVAGPDPDRVASWPARITERPDDPDGTTVHVSGGLATSTTLARRWRTDGRRHHHLLDPRTGRPVPEVLRTATCAGSTCLAANTASTAALVLGEAAVPWLDRHGVTARLVGADGSVTVVGGWPTPSPHRPEEAT